MWKDSNRNIVVIFQPNILRIVGFYVRHSAVIPCQLSLYLLGESLATILSKSYDVTRMAKKPKTFRPTNIE